ncbi:MAG TPA: hypothetical protein VL547_19650 [Dinghuibacter sp.]|uniref:hypothetical protein n=1 Tax=Dinghuibacter sp. TaxID=2024697 RepID=UPI002C00677E|nr:hypothetical protein [Dinghuibacter sp.]HTJ14268.1 hypothetical protein [Dinghuibacter sp.]
MKKYFAIVPALLLLVACRKYAEGPATLSGGAPAYLRVFNVIPFALTPFNSAGTTPFFTFLFDPQMDAQGIPKGGAIVGDFLGTRQLYCTSYSINEGNGLNASLDTAVKTAINYEYPGEAHVLAAPPINGFDLSAWAQVPSGKHRVLFISRPQTDTPFASLSGTIRKSIVIDTTIDLQAGEVYTLEAVAKNLDSNLYGAYLRQEQFIHQSFSDSNMYVGLFNLSGKPSAINPAATGSYPDSMDVNCTYYYFDDISNNANGSSSGSFYLPVPGFNNALLTTLNGTMATTTQYLPLPILPNSYNYDEQGIFRKYYGYGQGNSTYGTLPNIHLYFTNANLSGGFSLNPIEVDFDLDPALINDVQPYLLNSVTNQGISAHNNQTQFQASMSLFSNFTGTIRAYPCVNVLEIVYNTIYFMRIQPAFYNTTNR